MKKMTLALMMLVATLALSACTSQAPASSEEAKATEESKTDEESKSSEDNKKVEPERIDKLTIGGKEYEAEYYGKEIISPFYDDFSHREFWKVKDGYEDFADAETTGNVLPYDNYPMEIELNELYVIEYVKNDGSIIREVHKNEAFEWKGQKCTEQVITEEKVTEEETAE